MKYYNVLLGLKTNNILLILDKPYTHTPSDKIKYRKGRSKVCPSDRIYF